MTLHQKIRRIYAVFLILVFVWLGNSVRAQGFDRNILESDETVIVQESSDAWEFIPATSPQPAAFIFFPGGLVDPTAYAPMAHTLAEQGFRTVILKLPLRSAPLPQQETAVFTFVQQFIASEKGIERWIIGGHSRGGAMATRFAHAYRDMLDGLVLIGTSHPKEAAYDLSRANWPVMKIYASNDGLASVAEVEQNKGYLPDDTQYVKIEGGNHAQFGWYGSQLGDYRATIGRETQQHLMIEAILTML